MNLKPMFDFEFERLSSFKRITLEILKYEKNTSGNNSYISGSSYQRKFSLVKFHTSCQ